MFLKDHLEAWFRKSWFLRSPVPAKYWLPPDVWSAGALTLLTGEHHGRTHWDGTEKGSEVWTVILGPLFAPILPL